MVPKPWKATVLSRSSRAQRPLGDLRDGISEARNIGLTVAPRSPGAAAWAPDEGLLRKTSSATGIGRPLPNFPRHPPTLFLFGLVLLAGFSLTAFAANVVCCHACAEPEAPFQAQPHPELPP